VGKYIGFVDSDVVVPRTFLRNLILELESESGQIAGIHARVRSAKATTYLERREDWNFERRFNKSEYTYVLPTMASVWRRDILRRFPFDSTLAEDVDLSYRMQRAGYRFKISRTVYVRHYHRSDVKAFVKQNFLDGRARGAFIWKWKKNFKFVWNYQMRWFAGFGYSVIADVSTRRASMILGDTVDLLTVFSGTSFELARHLVGQR
jgi:cellulose synthase/poly-beta-1,6-N-acetylglucosamine synthase-like glycosyltransferase